MGQEEEISGRGPPPLASNRHPGPAGVDVSADGPARVNNAIAVAVEVNQPILARFRKQYVEQSLKAAR